MHIADYRCQHGLRWSQARMSRRRRFVLFLKHTCLVTLIRDLVNLRKKLSVNKCCAVYWTELVKYNLELHAVCVLPFHFLYKGNTFSVWPSKLLKVFVIRDPQHSLRFYKNIKWSRSCFQQIESLHIKAIKVCRHGLIIWLFFITLQNTSTPEPLS